MSRLLVLNFFPAFVPPRSGGEERYFHLYSALSRHFDVTLVSPTYPDHAPEVVRFGPRLREHRVPKGALHVRLHQTLDAEGIGPECSGLVCALASADDDAYRRLVRQLLPDADAVIHEFPYMLGYDEGFGRDGRPRVYNSHNLEARMAADLFSGPQRDRYVRFVADLESRLVAGSDLIFATSENERREFHARYGCPLDKIALAPNGFQPREPGAVDALAPAAARQALQLPPGGALAIFLGSAHPPNRDAAQFICDRLAPALPTVRFALAGSVCASVGTPPANVTLLGVVSDEQKALLFRACDVALNPVTSGAGTNLKLLDYFAAGLAVTTTDFGARGLAVVDDRHCRVCPLPSFADAVRDLVGDAERRARLGGAAAEFARAGYAWSAIADTVRDALETLLARLPPVRYGGRRPRLLVLNSFPVAAAEHGGQVRLRSLLAELSRRFDVTLLCLSDDLVPLELRITDAFTEIRVPRTEAHRQQQAAWQARRPGISTADILDAQLCRDNAALVGHYQRLLRRADAVVLAHPYLAPLLDVVPPSAPVVYEALNVEVDLKAELLADHPDRDALLAAVAAVEDRACAHARRVVCVSEDDRRVFARRLPAAHLAVIANGVDLAAYETTADLEQPRRILRGKPVAVFLGSGHPPNVEAVRFILERLAPACPDVVFLIVGGAGDAVRHHRCPANVLLCGFVSVAEKVCLLQLADVAINPMRSGGGSSLKVAEYLAAGLPLLSTSIGLRGFDLAAGRDAVVTDLDAFPGALAHLLAAPGERARLSTRGRTLACQRYGWDTLAERYGELLGSLIAQRPVRLLACTFRFTDPPLGGAETYLFQLLQHLPRERFVVDVATFDVGRITTVGHFGAAYEPGTHATPAFARHVSGFAVEVPARAELMDDCRGLFDLWQREELPLARSFIDRFTDVVLLGGWYPAERYPDHVQRWSGARAELYCPAGCRALTIHGRAPTATPIDASIDGRPLHRHRVRGAFTLRLELAGAAPGVLALDVDARSRDRRDPRRLGICVTRIGVEDDAGCHDLPLADDYATRVRTADPAAWISALIATTLARRAGADASFERTRGPRSHAFERWLADHVAGYDLVLAHGTPFSPAVAAGDAAFAAGIPYVVLPHYHMDDRYYHWQRYYELFRRAACVLAFPDRSLPLFFEPIGARAVTVPGGGIDPAEFADLEPARRAFRALHASARPFVLVLGRKEANKGYHRVVAAVERLRGRGLECEVVLIGRDEDDVPLTAAGAHAYGEQPRPVALGALASCACLATMSESESFGIVIVEAWACGKPVVANGDCPAFAELVEHGRDGLLCQDDESLTAAIGRLLAEPSPLAQRLGAAGQAKALAHYTWAGIARAVTPVLQGAATSARPAVDASCAAPATPS